MVFSSPCLFTGLFFYFGFFGSKPFLDMQINKWSSALVLLSLLGFLVLIRVFEAQLFYDPFLDFFKSEYANLPYPDYKPFPFFLSLVLRYSLNSMVSLAILYVVFQDRSLLKFSGILYLIFLVVLLLLLFLVLYFLDPKNAMFLFYVRRFLIQPIFLVLFLPAFYYQKKTS